MLKELLVKSVSKESKVKTKTVMQKLFNCSIELFIFNQISVNLTVTKIVNDL
jgi:hypothetical protein